jgi:hypothetical protein
LSDKTKVAGEKKARTSRRHLSDPMAFDPLSLLILKFRGRGVAVFRDRCTDYDVSRPQYLFSWIAPLTTKQQKSIISVARRSLRPLQLLGPDAGDLILLSSIPGYPDTSEVELTKDVWPTVSSIVHSVTIFLESGASVTHVQLAFSSLTSPFSCLPRDSIGVLRVRVQLYGRLS